MTLPASSQPQNGKVISATDWQRSDTVRFEIVHQLRYCFAEPIKSLQLTAKLEPRSGAGQRLERASLQLEPAAAERCRNTDDDGNGVEALRIAGVLHEAAITARSLVAVDVAARRALRERFELAMPRYDAGSGLRIHRDSGAPRSVGDQQFGNGEFGAGRLLESGVLGAGVLGAAALDSAALDSGMPDSGALGERYRLKVAGSPQLRRLAQEWVAGADRLPHVLAAVISGVRATLSYDRHASQPGRQLSDVLRTRRGVCQDFAHLAIAVLRQLGLAACYIGGYVPADAQLLPADAALSLHAWIGLLVPQYGWIQADPTRGVVDCDRYVVGAIGRDYWDTLPLHGSLSSATRTLRYSDIKITVAASPGD